jgi:hypothetical protein
MIGHKITSFLLLVKNPLLFAHYYIFLNFYHNSLVLKVGKRAESPQTRINTGFLLVKSRFLKAGKTGQMARNLTIIHKFSPN